MAGEFEIFIALPDSQWNEGVLLSKYQETYSLISAAASKKAEGTVYKKWCYPQKKDGKASEKTVPIKITLGNRQSAITVLERVLAELKGLMGAPKDSATKPPSDDDRDEIPF